MIWTSVCSGADRFHAVLSWVQDGGLPVVQFAEYVAGGLWTKHPAIQVPAVFRSVRVAASGAQLVAIGKRQDDGRAWLVNAAGLCKGLGDSVSTHGEQCVGIEPLGDGKFRVGVVRSAATWETYHVDGATLEAVLVASAPNPQGWADGWTDFKNGVPLWIPEHRHWTDGTHEIAIWLDAGPYRIGQSYIDGADAYGPHGWQRVCSSDTPIPPYAAALGDLVMVAMSADNPQFIVSTNFGPLPSAVAPEFPDCTSILSIGFDHEPNPVDWGEWCVLDKETNTEWQAKIDKARERHVPIVGDWDVQGQVFDWQRFKSFASMCEGVRAIPALRFYPLPGETTEQSVARWRPFAVQAQKDHPGNWGYVFCAYRQWNGTTYPLGLQQVLDGWHAAYLLGLECKARQADGFSWRRPSTGTPVDGVMAFPEMQEAADRMYAAVPSARLYPLQPDGPHPPDPPKPEPPDPPKPVLTEQEFLIMNVEAPRPGTTLIASHFKEGGYAGRWLYPMKDDSGNPIGNLALDSNGNLTTNNNNGPGESWIWTKGSGKARIESVNFAFTYTVFEDLK